MVERMCLPDGLAAMPPGPELAGVLAGLDRRRLNGHDLVVVMAAQARQVAHEQARLLADVYEVSRCGPGGPDSPVLREAPSSGLNEFVAAEVSAALLLTRNGACDHLAMACGLAAHPGVHAALERGEIDLPRARVLVEGLSPLTRDQAGPVAEAALECAKAMTSGQLRAKLAALIIAVDPDAARWRYRRAVRERRVVHGRTGEGTAYLSGSDLPADRAAAAWERVNAIADELKRGGDARPIDQIRADVYLDLLHGHEHSEADTDQPVPGEPVCARGPARATAAGGRVGVTDIVVSLPTLAGLATDPGSIPGWGPVLAEIARQVGSDPRRTWRYRAIDGHGRLVKQGRIRTRPTPPVGSPAAEYAFVKARDGRCRFPTCRVPARHCQVDHTTQRQHGGKHTRGNLCLVCVHHHRAKDEGGYQLRQLDDGRLEWTTPLGHTYTTGPEEEPPF
jgi:hypothetical protein